jgi:hypothetical protein
MANRMMASFSQVKQRKTDSASGILSSHLKKKHRFAQFQKTAMNSFQFGISSMLKMSLISKNCLSMAFWG